MPIIVQFLVGGFAGLLISTCSFAAIGSVLAAIFGNYSRPLDLAAGICVVLSLVAPIVMSLWFSIREYLQQKEEAYSKEGLCRQCGYDLRAATNRCPECGAYVSQKDIARIKRVHP
jgi:predicted Zn-ribbon and HTH transcriptional regulator